MDPFATLEEFKSFLRIPLDEEGGDNDDDDLLTNCLTAASRSVLRASGRAEVDGAAVPEYAAEDADTLKLATMMQAARWVKRRDAPFGVAGSPELGNMLRLLPKLDPDVEAILNAIPPTWYAV